MNFKALTMAGLLACTLPAFAQSPTTQMPEGSKDIELSLNAALVQAREGKSAMKAIVLPSASVQWSNGVFLAPGELGMQISEDPTLRFGPLLEYEIKSRRADDPDDKVRLGVEAGGFLRYRPLDILGLNASMLYGGGDNNRGATVNLGASFSQRLSPHQSVSLSTGVTLADRNYMQSYFGVDSAQALRGHYRQYLAGAGIKDVSASINWNVELTTRYSLNTGISVSRLGSNAAASPLVEQRSTTALWSSLTYHW